MDHVLNWLWQGVLVAGAAHLVLLVLTRARAGSRYGICCGGIAAVLALPALGALALTVDGPVSAAAPPGLAIEVPAVWWSSSTLLLAGWTIWMAACVARGATAVHALRAARTAVRRFPADVESRLETWNRVRARGRRAQLALSDRCGAAGVLPLGRPMIAVSPRLLERLSAEELDRVIVHEWAHVQRRDDVGSLAHLLVQTIAGWHPGIWALQRQLVVERESACDEIAIAETGSARRYAASLARTADAMHDARAPLLSAGVLSSPSLRSRVVRVLSAEKAASRARSWRAAAAAVLLLIALSVSIAGISPVTMASEFEQAVTQAVGLPARAAPAMSARPATSLPAARRLAARDRARTVPSSLRLASDVARARPAPLHEAAVHAEETDAPAAPTATPLDHRLLMPGDTPHLPPAGLEHRVDVQTPAAPSESRRAASNPQTPWDAAAEAGVAIGRASQTAAVRTSGFLSRFGRKVAFSF